MRSPTEESGGIRPRVLVCGLEYGELAAARLNARGYAALAVNRDAVRTATQARHLVDVLVVAADAHPVELAHAYSAKGGRRMPVLVIGGSGAVESCLEHLEAGAADFIVEPHCPEELEARIRVLLLRGADSPESPGVLRYDDVELDPRSRQARRAGQDLHLTRTEFDLLRVLLEHAEIVVSRSSLLRDVWDLDFDPRSNRLAVFVGYLRRKLEQDGRSRLVHSVRGVGYILRRP